MRVHLWGELGFYGPGKRGRFEFPIAHEMPMSDALRLIGVPEADVAVFGRNGAVVRLEMSLIPSIAKTAQPRSVCGSCSS